MATEKKVVKKKAVKKTSKKKSAKKVVEAEVVTEEKHKPIAPWISLLVMIFIVAAIMLLFSFGPKLRAQGDDDLYNNFNFEEVDGLWKVHLEINEVPYGILFHHHPTELELIPVQEGTADVVRTLANHIAAGGQGRLYIVLNPDDPADMAIAAVDIAKVTGEKFGIYDIPTQVAMIKSSPKVSASTPVITCNDASPEQVVVWIKTKGDNLVASAADNPYCIVLQSTVANQSTMVADRFVYELFGIM